MVGAKCSRPAHCRAALGTMQQAPLPWHPSRALPASPEALWPPRRREQAHQGKQQEERRRERPHRQAAPLPHGGGAHEGVQVAGRAVVDAPCHAVSQWGIPWLPPKQLVYLLQHKGAT